MTGIANHVSVCQKAPYSSHISYRDAAWISRKQTFPATILKRGTYQAYVLFRHYKYFYFFLISRKIFCSCYIRITMTSKSRLNPQQSDEHPVWMWLTCIAIAQSTILSLYIPWIFAVIIQQCYTQHFKKSRKNTCRLWCRIKKNFFF